MEGSRSWSVEAKVFEVQIKGGDSGVRIYERSKKKKCSIFVRRDEIVWLIGALEEVAETGSSVVFWDQSRAGLPRLVTQKRSNRHGRFLMIEEFEGRRRGGCILVPEGRYGQGWARLMVELDGANSSIWERRTPLLRPPEPVADNPAGLVAKTVPAITPASLAASRNLCLGSAGDTQAAPAPLKLCGPRAKAPANSLIQARGALGPGVPFASCDGGVGMEEPLGGAASKGRWVQALLKPAPLSGKGECQHRLGKEPLRQSREEHVREGLSPFNAKLELIRCREWLKNIRDEVDIGLQRLDLVIKEVDLSGPGQGHPGCLLSAKPILKPGPIPKPGPNGKLNPTSKDRSVGLGSGPKGVINSGQPRRSNIIVASAEVGQVSGSGLSGYSKGPVLAVLGPQDMGCSFGPIAEAGWVSSNGVVSNKELCAPELAVGRSGLGVVTGIGSPAPVSSCPGESRSDSNSVKAGLEVVECSISSSKRGDSGQSLGSPTPAILGLKTPVRLSLGKRAVSTEPSKLQVYQRSRWRSPMPLQSIGPSCLVSRGLMGPFPVPPVRLDFDGVDVDPCEAVSIPPPAMSLGSALPSVEVVPESVSGEVSAGSPAMSLGSALPSVEVVPESVSGVVSAGSGMAGVDSVVAEKLDRALVVGEAAGLTCDGQPGLLNEFLGQIVVVNHSRCAGGVRGSQVLNES
jgi:hypothetical protein